MTEWPTLKWAKENLWDNGYHTFEVFPRTTNPRWHCIYCKTRNKKILRGNFKPLLEHIRSAKHQQNLTLAKLASDERT